MSHVGYPELNQWSVLSLLIGQADMLLQTNTVVFAQLLAALMVGLLIAFAGQLVLTSLGMAIALSLPIFHTTPAESSDASPIDTEAESTESTLPVGRLAGWGILATVNTVLFTACFLASKFSAIDRPLSGAIIGLVIWSAYCLLVFWISAQAASSVLGAVLDAATGGMRKLVRAIASLFHSADQEPITRSDLEATLEQQRQPSPIEPELLQRLIEDQLQQVVMPELAKLQAEIDGLVSTNASAIAAVDLWTAVESYLQTTDANDLTPKRIERHWPTLLDQVQASASEIRWPKFNRSAVRRVLSQRDDLSAKKQDRIVRQLEMLWPVNLEPSERLSYSQNGTETDQPVSEDGRSLTQTATHALQSAIDRVIETLPEAVEQLNVTVPNWSELAPVVLPIVMSTLKKMVSSHATNGGLSAGSSLWQPVLTALAESVSPDLADLPPTIVATAETLRDRSLHQVESIQQTAQDTVEALKQDAEQRVDQTRKAAATALWWLVATVSTGAMSAALAGAIAAGFDLTQFWPHVEPF